MISCYLMGSHSPGVGSSDNKGVIYNSSYYNVHTPSVLQRGRGQRGFIFVNHVLSFTLDCDKVERLPQ